MTKLAAVASAVMIISSYAYAMDTKRDWRPVPGHKGVYVDIASIRHFPSAPARDAFHAPGPDTTVDIEVNGHISEATNFWCSNPRMELGDVTFGELGDPGDPPTGRTFGVIPMKAARPIVCGTK